MNQIKKLRQSHSPKMSQEKLGNLVGVGRSTVAMWECGKSEPDNDTLIKLSEIFNVTTDYLLGLVNEPYFYLDNDRIKRKINSYGNEEEKPTPVSEDGPIYPPEYDLLSPEDKALVDNMIRSLVRAKQPTPPPDEDINREVEDYRRRLIMEKKQRDTSSPSSGAGGETA